MSEYAWVVSLLSVFMRKDLHSYSYLSQILEIMIKVTAKFFSRPQAQHEAGLDQAPVQSLFYLLVLQNLAELGPILAEPGAIFAWPGALFKLLQYKLYCVWSDDNVSSQLQEYPGIVSYNMLTHTCEMSSIICAQMKQKKKMLVH